MTTREENELLTRIENGVPMGRMLRQLYWLPAVLSSRLEAGGAPVRENQTCSSRAANWPSQSSVARLRTKRRSMAPSFSPL